MIRMSFLVTVVVHFAIAGNAAATDGSVLQIVDGSGATHDEALRDAFRSAVQRTVGIFVVSERELINDVLEKKVYAFSNGFIETYNEISLPNDGDRFRVRISALVRAGAVREKLKEAQVPLKEFDGPSYFAKAVTTLERRANMRHLLVAAFSDHPFDCIKAEIVGEPRVEPREDNTATVRLRIRNYMDSDRYAAAVRWLRGTLKHVATEKGEFTRALAVTRSAIHGYAYHTSFDVNLTNREWHTQWSNRIKQSRGVWLFLCPRLDAGRNSPNWDYYFLDDPKLVDIFKGLYEQAGLVRIELKNKLGETISTHQIQYEGYSSGAPHFTKPCSVLNPSVVRITPTANDDENKGDLVRDEVIRIPLDVLRATSSMKASVIYAKPWK